MIIPIIELYTNLDDSTSQIKAIVWTTIPEFIEHIFGLFYFVINFATI
jgi:hypothetical protein